MSKQIDDEMKVKVFHKLLGRELDRIEKGVKEKVFREALGLYIDMSNEDSVEWLAGCAPPGFNFNSVWNNVPLCSWAIYRNKPTVTRWLMARGAVISNDIREWAKQNDGLVTGQLVNDEPVERMFLAVVACGLASPSETEFTRFLGQGVYDYRILMMIMGFAFTEDTSRKRKV